MLYFAYGSNLHRAGMLLRCPAALPLGRAVLLGHALLFRSWADVEPRPGAAVAGGLWRVTPDCLAALDDYEDVASDLYRRVTLPVRLEGAAEDVEALVYRMTATHTAPPEPGYLAVIRDGCRDFGLDDAPVLAAARAAG
jgi:gamma-glutamylcyclotransferase (GGCT)/AIG2-like uncharacterized protein YtfP